MKFIVILLAIMLSACAGTYGVHTRDYSYRPLYNYQPPYPQYGGYYRRDSYWGEHHDHHEYHEHFDRHNFRHDRD